MYGKERGREGVAPAMSEDCLVSGIKEKRVLCSYSNQKRCMNEDVERSATHTLCLKLHNPFDEGPRNKNDVPVI